MNTLTFLNSPLLWGLALASIPLIIHLLFRRKYRRIDWAPMHYLKLSIQRNRRRIRLEQLLLLLLRTAIILLLFFLVARPVMHAEGLGKWLGGRSATSQILLIDDSLSMGHREAGRSALERAQELAGNLIANVGPKDRFTLVLASRPKQPLVREVEVLKDDKLVPLLADITPAETYTAWESTLKSLGDLITTTTYPIREVTIITDLRRAGWDKPLAELASQWASEQVRLRIFDVGSGKTNNVSLESFEQIDRLSLVGNPTHYEAVIRNNTDAELPALETNFIVDSKATLIRVPAIAAGSMARVPLTATFQEVGPHHVSLQLPDDDLPGDNQRWWVTTVQDHLSLVLVDGEPSSEPLGGETDFLALAMSLGIGEADAFQVEVITDSEWPGLADADPDLVVLANVANLTPPQVEMLEKMINAGVGLMIFPGEQIDPDNYNQLLFKRGEGLLPAPLEAVADEELIGLTIENDPPSPLDAMLQLNASVLERLRVRKFFQLSNPHQLPEGTRVLARWNNASGSPAALEKPFGAGRSMLWTITADKSWSDWPTEPSYVLAMREAARALARVSGGVHVLTTGESIRRSLPPKREFTSPAVEAPRAKEPIALAVETENTAGVSEENSPKYLQITDTRRAGLYKLTWKDSQTGPSDDLYAANPDARESDLTRMTADDARTQFAPMEIEVISAVSGSDTPLAVHGQEIWRTLAGCLLGFVCVEACFATWAGRQR